MPNHYFIEMGQGLAGDLQELKISSGTFYSCSAIVLFNSKSKIGGLYHYPASTIDRPDVQETLKKMIDFIKPDQVKLMKAGKDPMGQQGTPQEDITDLTKFFKTKTLVLEVLPQTCSWVGVSCKDGEIAVHNKNPWSDEAVPLSRREAGKLEGGAILFGKDKEHGK